MKPVKKIALLHSMCGIGKASLTNMMPILSTMGIEACPIPTVLLSSHTGGFGIPAKQEISADYIRASADHYRDNGIEFDAIFVGYLGSSEALSAVRYFVKQFPKAKKILDPIMGDHGTFYSNISQNHANAFHELCSDMDIIIPNFTEACFLTGQPFQETPDASFLLNLCERLHQTNVKQIIITSTPSPEGKRGILSSDNAEIKRWNVETQATDFHGTGDVFDAVLIGSYLQGKTMKESILAAHQFVFDCIHDSCKYDYPQKEGLLIERNLSRLV